jgi:hypothetical protein
MKSLPAGIIAPVVVATAGYAGGGESVSMKPKVDPGRGWGTGWALSAAARSCLLAMARSR